MWDNTTMMYKREQNIAWENEYRNPNMMTKSNEAQKDVRDFVRFYRKQTDSSISPACIDCGCGNGRNLIYLNEQLNANGIGFDISSHVINEAINICTKIACSFFVDDEKYLGKVDSSSIDIILDITMSPSLLFNDFNLYLDETARTLKNGGILCLRFLLLDGDSNARTLCKNNPGPEINTYIHPVLKNIERVISFSDMESLLDTHFKIMFSEKQTGYQKIGNQSYKRRYGVIYAKKI